MRRSASPLLWISLIACSAAAPGDDHDAASLDATPVDGTVIDADFPDFSRVYCHSGQTLYRLDTTTLEPAPIGAFNIGDPSITDIAVDHDDRMLGITLNDLFEIDPSSGAATQFRKLDTSELTSLSFVPVDLEDPSGEERLVAAASNGDVFEIDLGTGNASKLGSYGSDGADAIGSSGDIVAIADFGIFATVNRGDDFTDPDYLAEIDPVTWEATLKPADTGFDRIFGLGFWQGTLYGFVDTEDGGAIIEIDPTTGVGTMVDQGSIHWFGAGVTTDAPVIGRTGAAR